MSPCSACLGQSVSKLDTITDTKPNPFNCVCFQRIERKKGLVKTTNRSTGFLIRPNVVLTAAHNVHSNGFSNVKNIMIFPGRYKDTYTYDSIEISGRELIKQAVFVHPSYKFIDPKRIQFDFAIIIIPDSMIRKAKRWPTRACFDLDADYVLKQGDKINVAGFPAETYDGSLMTYQYQNVATVNQLSFDHDFETEEGNSGSPIWIERDGKKIVVGVHTFRNAATKLTKEYIDMILEWIKAHP